MNLILILSLQQHDGLPYCHKPCYATLFGPKGICNFNSNICGCLNLEETDLYVFVCERVNELLCIFHNISEVES